MNAICGKRGDAGVCTMPWDHCGEHERMDGRPINLTQAQRDQKRFFEIIGDWLWAFEYVYRNGGQ